MKSINYIIVLMFIGLRLCNAFGNVDHLSIPQSQPVDEATKSNLLSAFGKVSLHFVANHGQFPEEVIYYAKSEGATVYCTEQGLTFGFSEGSISLKFSGEGETSTRVKPEAQGELKGKVNYFIGNDPALWQTDIPTFKEVVYREVYPGIDLVYSGDQRRLKYTFYLQPHSDSNQIQMIYDGIEGVWIDDATGELVIQTEWGEMRDAAPVAYQEIEGVRQAVDISFRLIGEKRVGFALGDYDPNFMLTLDPGYSTYLGGSGDDFGHDIAVDSSGNAYVTGQASSSDFPTENPFQGSGGFDAFVTKLSSSGSTLIYSTYLGGSDTDEGRGIAVDSSGNAYVTGYTRSSDFPTQNPYDSGLSGSDDVFVTKLSSSGDTLIYSTYLGGSDYQIGTSKDFSGGIAVDSSGNAYVTGWTKSFTFPTENPFQDSYGGGECDAFVTKFSNSGNTLIYSTYLGGSGDDFGHDIAVDNSGNAYVTGQTSSSDFPTENPFQGSGNGRYDVFVTKLSNSGNMLIYSTYLGGGGDDYGNGIDVDSSGNAYITGQTTSSTFPTQNPYQGSNAGSFDAFVTKLSSDGNTLIYSTYLGGSKNDSGYDIAVDSWGSAYVTGGTTSSTFPIENPFQGSHGGGDWDAFVTKLSGDGNTLIYSTYLGGWGDDSGNGIDVDSSENTYVVGYTRSSNFPTRNPYQESNAGYFDVFVTSFLSNGRLTPDTTPPTPNTIASIVAVSATQIDITSTEAQDETPPVFYRLDGQYYDGASWVDSSGGVSDYDYSTTRPNPWPDTDLVENGWYRYSQQVKDSATPPNESTWSDWVEKATLLNPPQDAEITFANVTETGMDVTVATPPKPSGAGETGAYFDLITGEGQGSGANDRGYADDYTAEYTNLNPNTQYGWKVKYRNREGVETAYNPTEQKRYTLANTPSAPTVSNPTPTTLDVTIEPNGNPDYTLFAIYNVTGGYYLNANGGNSGDTEVWQTKSDWGTVTVVNLTPETTYEFKCKAKNGDGIETPLGASGYGTTTTAPDTTPPTPNTIASIVAVSATQIDITSTEAQDDTPPVFYHLDGQYYDSAAWVDSGGGVSDYDYSTTRPNPWSDTNLVENGWYRYRQKVKDSAEPPNESAWSDWVEKATLLNPPEDAEITFANVTTTGMDVTVVTPPKPSGAGSTGSYFDLITGEGQGSGAIDRSYADDYTAEYTILNPNTQYGWKVRYRNRDGVETAYNPTEQKRYTLANTPSAPTVSNPTPTTLDVTINPNGNPDHTLFAIYNVTGGYYVNATGGNNGDTEVWQTESDWGTVTVIDLTPETTYEFKCKAQNGDSIETPLGASGYGTTTALPDTTPPEAVMDLATSNPTDTQITLTWTAPGDDGDVGTASQYDIRYSTSPINEGNFSSATEVQGVPQPKSAGSPESLVVTGLSPETTYYFAMKTADEVPNWSDLSNVAQGTTTAIPPVIASLNPTSGVVGTQVTISGGNFGEEQGDSTVTFNGVDAGAADSWIDTEIKVKVPVDATTGPVVVTVNGQASNNDKIFTVIQPPIISSINPTSGPIGMQVTINGSNLGAQQGDSTVTFNEVNAGIADSWADTQIKIKVPTSATTGAVVVTVNDVESNKDKIFTVTAGVNVKLEPDEKNIPLGATANIDIIVENAPGVSAFEFKILYDSNVVSIKQPTDVILGPFLGSTGRIVFPIGPDIREDLIPAEVTFGAASLAGPNPLPTGDGVLASIVFTGVDVGTTSLDLTNVKLLDADAEKIPVSEEDGAITVDPILYGDVSDDGSVSAYDASLVLQHVVGLINLSPEQQEVADVTGDDTISALDAALILQYTVGLITSFPVDNPPVAPALNSKNENKLLTKAIEQLEAISLTKEQKQVLEQLKNLVFNQLIPKHTKLLPNYPNPFNPETWIPFELASDSSVVVGIYNVKGELVRTLDLGVKEAGYYMDKTSAGHWDGRSQTGEQVASGLYFYTIKAGKFIATRRMVMVK